MDSNVTAINELEHEDIICDIPDNCIQDDKDEKVEKIEDIPLKIVTTETEVEDNVEAEVDDIEPSAEEITNEKDKQKMIDAIPLELVERDKKEILEYLEELENRRKNWIEFEHLPERRAAINTINDMIEEWEVDLEEIKIEHDEGFYDNEDEYDPIDAYSENYDEGILHMMKVLDILGIDYQCKYCISRPACITYDSKDYKQMFQNCSGLDDLTEQLRDDVERYYIEKYNRDYQP